MWDMRHLFHSEALINIQWDPVGFLRCRTANRGAGRPDLVTGDSVASLLAWHRKGLCVVNVAPR